MNNIKTYLIIIVIVVIIGVLLTQFRSKESDNNVTIEPYAPTVTELDFTETPDDFPSDVPIESGAAVVLNNIEDHPTGTKATKVFITSQTPATNFSLYRDWLISNNWKLTAEINDSAVKILNAEKGDQVLTITISTHQSTGEKIVEIAVLVKK